MLKVQKLALVGALLLFSNITFAYGTFAGTVKEVRIDRSGLGIINFDGSMTGEPPACRTSYYNHHMSFNVNTEGGKAIYAMALAAVASGKQVSVIGAGSCDEYANIVESLSYWHFIK